MPQGPAYRLDIDAATIAQVWRADACGDVWAGGEVVPGGYAPVIVRSHARGRHLVPRLWGVPPPPRGEHVVAFVSNLDSPFWIGTLRHTQFRCLVPMTAFHRPTGWFTAGTPPFACAGIWRDSEIPSFAILSRGGLPAVLGAEAADIWLSADIRVARRMVEP